MSSLEKVQPAEVAPRFADMSPQYAEIMVLGTVFTKSGYFKGVADQAQAVTKILYGRELGMSPIVSMMNIYIVDGKPALSAGLLGAQIKKSGKYDYKIRKFENSGCSLMFLEKKGNVWEELGVSDFTIEDAKIAGLVNKNNWKNYPKAMCFARALSQGQRTYCPDIGMGPMYVPEELGATVDGDGDVTELPKPKTAEVPRTTEDIPLSGPAKSAAVDPHGAVKGGSEPEASTERSTGAEEPQNSSVSDGFIDTGMQANFARAFKAGLPLPLQPNAEALRHEWLGVNGFMHEGKPSSKGIKKSEFAAARDAAVKWASAKATA